MTRELIDENGKLRSKSAFMKAVKEKVDKDYNKRHLETEYNTAVASAQQARKWTTYVKRGGSITYVAVMDERTRIEHAGWNGVTLPVDHVFWNYHFPPNGYNCRCTTRWAGTEAKDVQPTTFEEIPTAFQNNVGESGQVFTDASPYFTVDGAFTKDAEKLFGFKPPVDLTTFNANIELFNKLSADDNYKLAFTDNLSGGVVFKHLKAGSDLVENMKAARILALRGDGIVVREVINQHGAINPDLDLNGILTEVKTNHVATFNAIDTTLRKAAKQADQVILNVESEISEDDLKKAIRSRVARSTIENMIVIYKGTIYEFERTKILMGDFWF